jgi:hypothetical protein
VPNWFFDEVLSDNEIPHAARSVFLFMLRKTVGWDNRREELSLTEIQYGASVTRPTAIHAVRVLTECWGLFHKTRGRKGQHSSVFTVGNMDAKEFDERLGLLIGIYDTTFPSPQQLREKPCTQELLATEQELLATERAKMQW